MESDHEKLFTVGELARQGGVTVRTLQYYDTSGLLVPSAYSEGGRRMYGKQDIVRLQQIIFLKSMGFSLEEIRDKILPSESAAELTQVFERQQHMLAEQIADIQYRVDQIGAIIEEIRSGNDVGIDRLFFIMRATKTGNPYSFMSRHMGKEQMEFIFQRFDEQAAAELGKSLQAFADTLIDLNRRNEKPEGAEGQKLAEMWWNLMMSVTEGEPSLIPWMCASVVRETNWPPGCEDLKEATLSFLRQAIFAYLKRNNMKLS